jgi:O-acetyl-ADP-ribose deacetylase (regulator of RNase III)
MKEQNIKSIAIPGLGCGLGSLDWDVVKPLIETYLNIEEFKDVNIEVYEPVIKFHGRKPVKKTIK